ncbi:MAG: hypothetical protein MEQ74_05105 [Paracoccus sp.]|nr:hypothetical protein [Paracoccus sp. (in: a-proteobacteria)]
MPKAAAPKTPKTMSVSAAADLVGVQRQTLGAWMKKAGMDTSAGVDLPKLLEWKFKFERDTGRAEAEKKFAGLVREGDDGFVDKEEAQRRKAVADAVIRELDLEERVGAVVPIEAVTNRVAAQYAAVRERFFAIPLAVCQDLIAQEDPQVIAARIRREVDDALEDLDEAAAGALG